MECFEDEDSQERIGLLNAVAVVASVEKLYDGGYWAFLRDAELLA